MTDPGSELHFRLGLACVFDQVCVVAILRTALRFSLHPRYVALIHCLIQTFRFTGNLAFVRHCPVFSFRCVQQAPSFSEMRSGADKPAMEIGADDHEFFIMLAACKEWALNVVVPRGENLKRWLPEQIKAELFRATNVKTEDSLGMRLPSAATLLRWFNARKTSARHAIAQEIALARSLARPRAPIPTPISDALAIRDNETLLQWIARLNSHIHSLCIENNCSVLTRN